MSKIHHNRQAVDIVIDEVTKYLEKCNWQLDGHTLFWVDPITRVKYHTMAALEIQTSRDLQHRFEKKYGNTLHSAQ